MAVVPNAGLGAGTLVGLLRRVLSISTGSDGSTILGTRTASIPEALTTFFLDWTLPPIAGAFGMSHGGATPAMCSAASARAQSFSPPPADSMAPPRATFGLPPAAPRFVGHLSTPNPRPKFRTNNQP